MNEHLMKEHQATILRYKEQYEHCPEDQELIRLYCTASSIEKKYGIAFVLQDRGYGKSDYE